VPARRIVISPQGGGLAIVNNPLPGANVGVAYATSLTAVGGNGSFTWSIVSQTGGNGWAINASTGSLTGTPIGAESDTLTIRVQDSSSPVQSAYQSFNLTVTNPVAAVTFSPAPGPYPGNVFVTLACATPASSIYYTINGGVPVVGQPGTTLYIGAFNLAGIGTDIIQAIATAPGFGQSAVTSATYTVSGQTFPQIGAYLIGGSRLYANATLQTFMKHLDIVITGCFDGWEANTGGTQAAFTSAVQSGSFMPNSTMLLSYFNPTNLIVGTTPYNVQSAANMMLVAAYPSNLTITTNGSYKVANICTNGTQPTVTSGTPLTARNANSYEADYIFDFTTNGGGLGLAGNPVATNFGVNGYFIDDFNCYPIAGSGDYLRNNTTQAGGTDSTTAQALALRQGFATFFARLKTNKYGALVFANLSGMYNNPLTTGVQGVLDGGIAEHAMGDLLSADTQGTNTIQNTFTILGYQYAVLKAGGKLLFIHSNVTDTGTDFWRTNPGQAIRYGLATSLMSGCVYAITPTGNSPNTTPTSAFNNNEYDSQRYGAAQWFDEFSVNPTTLIAYAYGDANINLGMHWMGAEIDTGMVTTAWQNGVIRKRYQMANGRQAWALLNPRGNGAQTITLGQRMQAISGTQVPAVNNGNTNVTTITIPDADARFLVSYP
jgi:hypothetical protein